MQIEALGDRIIAKRMEDKETVKDGIVIPDTAQERPQIATVISVGAGRVNPVDGSMIPLSLKAGDKILLPKYGTTEVQIEEEECVICKEDDVLAKLTDKRSE